MRVPSSTLRARFPRIVFEVLASIWDRRDDLALLRVSLTLPDSALDWHREAAELFAGRFELESDRTGAILVLDLAPGSHREHYYGLVLTREQPWEVDHAWSRLVGGVPTRQAAYKRVRPVTGQRSCWASPTREFTSNVRRVANYAAKPLPRSAPQIALVDRVVTTGLFVEPYAFACSQIAESRHCDRCHASIAGKRRQARYCSVTCQKLGHRARKRSS